MKQINVGDLVVWYNPQHYAHSVWYGLVYKIKDGEVYGAFINPNDGHVHCVEYPIDNDCLLAIEDFKKAWKRYHG